MKQSKIQEYRHSGWTFDYDNSTKFIGATHKQGGKQSTCVVGSRYGEGFGNEIVSLMNDSPYYNPNDFLNEVATRVREWGHEIEWAADDDPIESAVTTICRIMDR